MILGFFSQKLFLFVFDYVFTLGRPFYYCEVNFLQQFLDYSSAFNFFGEIYIGKVMAECDVKG